MTLDATLLFGLSAKPTRPHGMTLPVIFCLSTNPIMPHAGPRNVLNEAQRCSPRRICPAPLGTPAIAPRKAACAFAGFKVGGVGSTNSGRGSDPPKKSRGKKKTSAEPAATSTASQLLAACLGRITRKRRSPWLWSHASLPPSWLASAGRWRRPRPTVALRPPHAQRGATKSQKAVSELRRARQRAVFPKRLPERQLEWTLERDTPSEKPGHEKEEPGGPKEAVKSL